MNHTEGSLFLAFFAMIAAVLLGAGVVIFIEWRRDNRLWRSYQLFNFMIQVSKILGLRKV